LPKIPIASNTASVMLSLQFGWATQWTRLCWQFKLLARLQFGKDL
jgi:hypothetical protein